MTCIVGLADGRNVWMGGDSCAGGGTGASTRLHSKVFRKNRFDQPSILIGYTSSFRMGQALQFGWKVPEMPSGGFPLMEWMCVDFVDSVRERLADVGFKKSSNGVETGGTFLVGVKGRLFMIEDDFQVAEMSEPYNAVGCGCDLALGSMFSTGRSGADMAPVSRIELALSAAAQWSAYVRAPFHVEILKGDD